jgi:hypothetical protein
MSFHIGNTKPPESDKQSAKAADRIPRNENELALNLSSLILGSRYDRCKHYRRQNQRN